MTLLKTPDEWLKTDGFAGITIMDPDGWDRRNFAERISATEMCRRLSGCAITMPEREG